MPKLSGLGFVIAVNGYNLGGDVGAINSIASPRGVVDATGVNSSALERLLTHCDGTIDFSSHFNDASGQEHDALKTVSGAATSNISLLQGSTAGNLAAMLVALRTDYAPSRGQDGSLTISVQAQGNRTAAPLEWAEQLTAGFVTHASAASSASTDDTAGTSNGIAAMIQATSIGSGTATPLIEHSTNDSTWATLVTFTNITARTSERATATSTVNRYLRFTTTGVFTNLVASVIYRRGVSQDTTAY